MTTIITEILGTIEFVAHIDETKDCLMSQDPPESHWFNIDVPKGHGLKEGDRIKVTIERA
ncbi:MAG: hypothetical protein D5R99_05655 [Methanocalculus sp. MSAO_Arc1]|uniref:hypothetical protein n=1 Tax=Methanocalculus TaxID=71151 RepID=UPI000FEF20E2|nr:MULTISPECIES: hypothetical protein [unclassified Methanocalculus]MCP1661811.1 hypothetical protein [Methanocalculus sp. AMF5]RQD80203.1 MAG: hypothetical protein D5R99_05655 [Methanocalculus sp. MSAO_Arc1]